ncbi:MAG: tRNA (N(6)-L-threonylcarbamoyladenosine(37)-C(2))-methylthiotransferase MtaB [Rikenellaceae bacterium]
MSLRVSFHTLGCKLNFSESSTLARHFEQGGFTRVESAEESDICVINSCSVTETSDKKCRYLIRRLHRNNPNAIIAVTGCYAQLRPDALSEIEGVDIVLSNNDKAEMVRAVEQIIRDGRGSKVVTSCTTDELKNFFSAFSSGDRTRAFLKVQDGCDYKCAYCTIHYARGASRNAPITDLVEQARKIAESGQREVVITGINTGDFGRSTGERFIDLLRALAQVEGIERYRISSIEPNLLSDEIIEFCAKTKSFQHHFHIPLQSGSDYILGRMRRRYRAEKFADRVEQVRKFMPDTFFGVDVIVGFPGESEEHFMQTYNLLERLKPAFLHIFPYSERRGTPAVELDQKVPHNIANERVKRLEELSDKLHREFCSQAIGAIDEVLFESTVRGGSIFGYTGEYRRVRVPYQKELINRVVRVHIEGIDESGAADLIGVVAAYH